MTTPPTLARLVTVRAQFNRELEVYLTLVGADLVSTNNFFPEDFDPATIRQRVLVRQERLRYNDNEARQREMERREAFADEGFLDERLERAYSRKEDDEEEQSKVVDWETLRGKLRRGIILGDPGLGKSFLLRHEARRRAAVYTLTSPSTLPILLRLADIAAQITGAKGDPIQAIAAAIKNRYITTKISDRFIQWLINQISEASTVLLLDALDEVPTNQRTPLREVLGRLADRVYGTILLTSRIVGYGGAPFPLTQDERSCEVELTAFDPVRIASFVTIWFVHAPAKGQALQAHLRRHPTIRSMARTPLLLAFLCLLANDTTTLPTTRAALYEDILERLLIAGELRARGIHEPDPERISKKVSMLQRIAWHFATGQDRWRDLLPGAELSTLLNALPEASYLKESAPSASTGHGGNYRGLLVELSENDGIFVSAGVATRRMAAPYLFLHRTIHEYLVASYLAAQPTEIWQAHVRAIGVFDADWIEVLVLLAGCLNDPDLLLNMLLEGGDDPFHQRQFLASQCVGEAGRENVSSAKIQDVVDRIVIAVNSSHEMDRKRGWQSLAAFDIGIAIPVLRRLLQSKSTKTRCRAAEALGELRDPAAIPALTNALQDMSSEVRERAAVALGKLRDPATISALTNALQDTSYEVRCRAAEALGELRDPIAIPTLINALHHLDDKVCERAAKLLRELGDPSTIPALINVLQDTDDEVRRRAAEALGKLGDPIAIPALIKTLQDTDDEVCRRAAEALGKLGDPIAIPALINVLQDAYYRVRERVKYPLKKMGNPAVIPALINALHHPNENVSASAAQLLGELRDPVAVSALINALQHTSRVARESAAEALGKLGGTPAIPALINALQDADYWVRISAAKSLGKLGDPSTIPALINALQDTVVPVRKHAAGALGKLGDSAAIPALINTLQDRSHEARESATEALGELRDPIAIPALINALQDAHFGVICRAAEALEKMRDPSVIPLLINALQDTDVQVRRRSAEALSLGKMRDPAVIPLLINALQDTDVQVRRRSAKALGKLRDPAAIPALTNALQDVDKWVKISAAESLRELRHPAAISPLINALQDVEFQMLLSAIKFQGELRDPTVIPALINALQDADYKVRCRAAEALGELGDPTAILPLIITIQDGVGDVKKSARQALVRFIAGDYFEQVADALSNNWYTSRSRGQLYLLLWQTVWRMKSLGSLSSSAQALTDYVLTMY